MEHVAALMLLVGCNADASACREIPVPVAAYENFAQCDSDLSLQIRLATSADKVYGTCASVREDVFEQSATLDWALSRSGKLLVIVDAEPQIVASR